MHLTQKDKQIHFQTQHYANAHRCAEHRLVELLLQIEDFRIHKKLGCTSLFTYVVDQLKLGESTAYSLCAVARKMREVPELKMALKRGAITLYKAGRVIPVLTKENAKEILDFAAKNTTRETDSMVAEIKPSAAIGDRARVLADNSFALQTTVSGECLKKLKRAQSLRASRHQNTSFESTLEAALDMYLTKHDPLLRAARAKAKVRAPGKDVKNEHAHSDSTASELPDKAANGACTQDQQELPSSPSLRVPLTAAEKHAVFLRDQGRCTHIHSSGERCGADRWLHIHHIKPVSEGGDNALAHLTLLCSVHHDLAHQLSFAFEEVARRPESSHRLQ